MQTRSGEGWEQLFWILFESSSSAIALLDEEGRFVEVNNAAVKLLGRSRGEFLGRRTPELGLLRPSDLEGSESEWQTFVRSGARSARRILVRPDGSEVEVEIEGRMAVVGGRRLAISVVTPPVDVWPSVKSGSRPEPTLTDREREVVTLIALGRTTPQIANELYISEATVNSHVGNAMSKLGTSTRAQLVATALSRGDTILPALLEE
jgi:PAS domain S-box-containing protein